jgi:hypothetical protein
VRRRGRQHQQLLPPRLGPRQHRRRLVHRPHEVHLLSAAFEPRSEHQGVTPRLRQVEFVRLELDAIAIAIAIATAVAIAIATATATIATSV